MAAATSNAKHRIQWIIFLGLVKKCMLCGGGYYYWQPPPPPPPPPPGDDGGDTDDLIRGMPVMNISLEDFIKGILAIESETEPYYKDVDNADAENPELRGNLSNSGLWTNNWVPKSGEGEEGITLKKYKDFMKKYKEEMDEKRKKSQLAKIKHGRGGYWHENGTWIPDGIGGYWAKNGTWVAANAFEGGYWGPDGKWVPGPDGGAGYWAPNGTWIPMPGDEGGHFGPDGEWIVGPGGEGGGFWGANGEWVPGPKAGKGYYGKDGTWYGRPTRPPGAPADWPDDWNAAVEYIPDTPPPYAYVSKSYGKPGLCFQEPKKGNCQKYHIRWGFNVFQKDCVEFVYSGCGGNMNNFLTKKRCREVCLDMPKSDCSRYPPELMPHDCFPDRDFVTWVPQELSAPHLHRTTASATVTTTTPTTTTTDESSSDNDVSDVSDDD